MEDKDVQLIDNYFENRLPDTERVDFEKRMAADPAFADAVRLHGLALEAVRQEGRQALKQQLRERQPFVQPKPRWYDFRWWIAGLALTLIPGAIWWVNQERPRSETPVAEPPAAPQQTPPTIITPPSNAPQAVAASNEKQLFAAHFRPFRSGELTDMVRGGGDETPFQVFVKAYLNKQYSEALRLFEKLPEADKADENILFLKANALLGAGQTNRAIVILDKICTDKTSRYTTEAQWLLGLAYLKINDWKKAEPIFLFIKTANGGKLPHAAGAAAILKDYSSSTKPAQ